ncbi:unnamed protein product [Ranitomeya imitator]|uniref:Insertion element IS150 protein InsJ-like helix-turn-helix domain-containing protein n=1 Tax=Ranitomeya imitator TaxID=111125 RepID=A0ABN9KUQ5_9NEOB|nr:unnamed protein product [Ranitomeya imitator]
MFRSGVPAPELGFHMRDTDVFLACVIPALDSATVLKNGTEVFNDWVNPPPPIYMQFYFFNVTNPLEVLDGEKPVVDEIGPYTYREYRPKENVEFLRNGTKVFAVNPKTYIFEPNKSVGDPKVDLIRTINIPIVTLLEMTRNNKYFKYIKAIVAAVLKTYNENIFLTRSVDDLLWGYKDPVLSLVHTVVPEISEMFGLFYNMNATNDGTYVFLSGSEGYMDFTKIVEWNENRSLSWWTTDTCNMINGTDGTSFHPLINKDDIIYLFSSDLCRSIFAVYEASDSVKGISVFRFTPPAKVFANVTVNPDNAGYCVPKGNCLPSGLLNVSVCKQDAPIILSSPHFYQAEEFVINSVIGMKPKKEDHETFMDINPKPSTPDLHLNCNLSSDSMPKIHPATKAWIIKRLKTRSSAEVAGTFNVSQRQVQRIKKRFEETGDVFDKPRSGRPRKTTAQEERLVVRKSKASPSSTAAELHQACCLLTSHFKSLCQLEQFVGFCLEMASRVESVPRNQH